jgi:hypothetical protein
VSLSAMIENGDPLNDGLEYMVDICDPGIT